MTTHLYQEFDWSQFDAFRGDDPAITFPYLLDCLISDSEDTARHGHAGIVQWPVEIVRHVGRIGAVPQVIRCIFDLLMSRSVAFPKIALHAVGALREGISFYVFNKRYFAESRADLAMNVDRTFNEYQPFIFKTLETGDLTSRIECARLLQHFDVQEIVPRVRELCEREIDTTVQRHFAAVLGRSVPESNLNILLDHAKSQDHPLKLTAHKLLSLATGKAPNSWIVELCQAAFITAEGSFFDDWDAICAIEELSQDSWAFAMAFWMDRIEQLSGAELVSAMHGFLETIVRWHWNRGFFWYGNKQIGQKMRLCLSFLSNTDQYWLATNAAADKKRESLLGSQLGLPVDREELFERFGRFH